MKPSPHPWGQAKWTESHVWRVLGTQYIRDLETERATERTIRKSRLQTVSERAAVKYRAIWPAEMVGFGFHQTSAVSGSAWLAS
jgi:hypothetical protein